MAWLTGHSATNKVVTSYRKWTQSHYNFIDSTTVSRTVTVEEYEYVGMTKAAADTCLAAMFAAGLDAQAQSENNGGGWKVIVNGATYGAWA